MALHMVRCSATSCPTCEFLKRGPSIDSAGCVAAPEDFVRNTRTDTDRSVRLPKNMAEVPAHHDSAPVQYEHNRAVVPARYIGTVVRFQLENQPLIPRALRSVNQHVLDKILEDNARLIARNAELEKRVRYLEEQKSTSRNIP